MRIPIPGLKTSIGAGDVVASATQAVGITPCGGCKQRQALMNRLQFVPVEQNRLILPAGFELRKQGRKNGNTQIVLAQYGNYWVTWEYINGSFLNPQGFYGPDLAVADFTRRMNS